MNELQLYSPPIRRFCLNKSKNAHPETQIPHSQVGHMESLAHNCCLFWTRKQFRHAEPLILPSMQAVGGNTALALLLTVGTNLAGIFTMPFVLSAILGTGASAIHIDPAPLLRALIETILVPLLAGMAARAFIPGGGLSLNLPVEDSLVYICKSLIVLRLIDSLKV